MRPPLRTAAKLAWALVALAFAFGGAIGWFALGAALCEDYGSPGSDAYCNGGGWEASGIAIATSVLVVVVVPAAAILLRRRSLFAVGIAVPIAAAALTVVASWTLGTD